MGFIILTPTAHHFLLAWVGATLIMVTRIILHTTIPTTVTTVTGAVTMQDTGTDIGMDITVADGVIPHHIIMTTIQDINMVTGLPAEEIPTEVIRGEAKVQTMPVMPVLMKHTGRQ